MQLNRYSYYKLCIQAFSWIVICCCCCCWVCVCCVRLKSVFDKFISLLHLPLSILIVAFVCLFFFLSKKNGFYVKVFWMQLFVFISIAIILRYGKALNESAFCFSFLFIISFRNCCCCCRFYSTLLFHSILLIFLLSFKN